MQKKLVAPPKLTAQERKKTDKFIWMADWHFDATIKRKCTEMSKFPIYYKTINGEGQWVHAKVYGLQAVFTNTEEPCIANFFIRYENLVYQVSDVIAAGELIQLLKKEYAYDEYEDKLWKQQFEERQRKQKAKEKGKVRKLRVVSKAKVA